MDSPVVALSRHSHRPMGLMLPFGFLSGATLRFSHILVIAGRSAMDDHIAVNCRKVSVPVLVLESALMCEFRMPLGPGSAPVESEYSRLRAASSEIGIAGILLQRKTAVVHLMASSGSSGFVWNSFLIAS